jgi:endogenous inhibitor of DNA gyrase (YacG/DUF329 family)
LPRCPTCGAAVDVKASPAPPFCSARCQQIDLGRWLGEKYAMPQETGGEDAAEQPSAGGRVSEQEDD